MQTSPFDTGYPSLHHHQSSGIYGTVPGFEPGGFKFHPSGYPESSMDAAACYQNYVNSNAMVPQGYGPREPPSYAESTTAPPSSTIFHSGFMTNSSPGYYKVSGSGTSGGGSGGVIGGGGTIRQMDMMADYGASVRTSAVADNFLMK